NHSDPACAWDRACYRIAHPAVVDETAMTRTAAEELPGFAFVERAAVPWLESITRADYVRRWLPVSSFITATPEEGGRMVAAGEAVLAEHADARRRRVLPLPQVTDVFVYRRSQCEPAPCLRSTPTVRAKSRAGATRSSLRRCARAGPAATPGTRSC